MSVARQKIGRANIPGLRQQTQYSCLCASVTSIARYYGKDVNEEQVNKVLGAAPMRGARWEEALATLAYLGLRGTMVVPATIEMLRDWTGRGIPVMIAWKPMGEARSWSHASVVIDVDDQDMVHIMDPNIPNPSKTVRILSVDEFCEKWYEMQRDDLLVRRPAVAVEREITTEGKQVIAMASKSKKPELPKQRNPVTKALAEGYGGTGKGKHHNRDWDVEKGRGRKEKHKTDWSKDRESGALSIEAYKEALAEKSE